MLGATNRGEWLGRLMAICALFFIAPPSAQAIVSNSGGAATIEQAIKVPPGVGGVAPTVSLSYSSRNGPGIAGQGWSLTGISLIVRCSAIFPIDGLVGGTRFTSNDKLCLDGDRLIPTDASGGTPVVGTTSTDAAGLGAGAFREYRTETDSYSRIRAYGYADGATAAAGPQFFKVWTKDGRVLEFGDGPSSNTDTRATIRAYYPAGQSTAYASAWAVSRISDLYGNYIDFKYGQSTPSWGSNAGYSQGHEWWLKEVQYSGNKVLFNYSTRAASSPQDAQEAYLAHTKTLMTQRLESVSTYINSPNTTLGAGTNAVPVSTLKLAYDAGPVSKRSRLISMQECAGGPSSTKCLAPTVMSYTAGAGDTFTKNTSFNLGGVGLSSFGMYIAGSDQYGNATRLNVDFAAVDMNGDGKTDIVRWDEHSVTVYYSNGDGTFSQNMSYDGSVADPNSQVNCGFKTSIADINGDGLPDIIRYRYYEYLSNVNTPGCDINTVTEIHLNSPNGTFSRLTTSSGAFKGISQAYPMVMTDQGWAYGKDGKTLYFLDINGDGLADVVTTIGNSPYPGTDFNYGSTCNDPGAGSSTACTHVYMGDGAGGFNEISTNLPATTSLYAYEGVLHGLPNIMDVDGDGRMDIVRTNRAAAEWDQMPGSVLVALNRGNGNFDLVNGPSCSTNNAVSACGVSGLDYSGSGRQALLYATDSSPTLNSLFIASKADGTPVAVSNFNLTTSNDVLVRNSSQFGVYKPHSFYTVDINGDGRDDIFLASADPTENKVYLSNGDGTFTPSTTFNLTTSGNDDMRFQGNASQKFSGSVTRYSTIFGNFTGSGAAEILRVSTLQGTGTGIGSPNNVLWVKSSAGLDYADLLSSVTGPSGLQEQIVYAPAGNATFSGNALGNRYTTDRGTTKAAVAPTQDVAPSGAIVVSIIADSGVGTTTVRTEYAYAGAKADRGGRGYYGFRETTTQTLAPDGSTFSVRESNVAQFPYVGKVETQERFKAALNATSTGNRSKSLTNLYCDSTAVAGADTTALSSGVHCASTSVLRRPYLLRSVQTGQDISASGVYPRPTMTTIQSVTTTGDPLTVSTTTSTGPGSDTFVATTTNTYLANDVSCTDSLTCTWKIGLVDTQTVRKQAPNYVPTTVASSGNPHVSLRISPVTSNSGQSGTPNATTLQFNLFNDGDRAVNDVQFTHSGTSTATQSPAGTISCPAASQCSSIITVTSPTAVGTYTGTLTLKSVSENVTASASYTETVQAPQLLTQVTSSTMATNLPPYSSSGRHIYLQNYGLAAVTVTGSPTTSGNISVWQGNYAPYCTFLGTIPSGTQCAVFVYAYGPAGSYSGNATLPTNAGNVVIATTAGISGNLTASTVNFGNVARGSTADATMTLTNTAAWAFRGLSVTASAPFSIVSNACGTVVPANGSCNVTVRYSPTSFTTSSANVAISGAYNQVVNDADSGSTGTTMNLSGAVSGTGTGAALSLAIATYPPDYPANSVSVGGVLTLTNSGNVAAPLSFNITNQSPTDIAWGTGSGTTCTASLAAGASCNYALQGNSTTATVGTQTFNFNASTTAAGSSPASASVALSVKATGAKMGISVTTAVPAFYAGQSGTGTVTVTNSGNVTASVNAPTFGTASGPASWSIVAGGSCGTGATTIAAGGSCTYQVNAAAASAGSSTNTVNVSSSTSGSNPASASTGVSATSIAAPTLSSLNFGSIGVGASSTQAAVIYNPASVALSMTVPTASSVTGTDFSFVSTNCTGSIPGGATCSVYVKFMPTAAVARSGAVSVSTAAGTLNSTLSGTGVSSFSATFNPVSGTALGESFGQSGTNCGTSNDYWASVVVSVAGSGTASVTSSGAAVTAGHLSIGGITNGMAVSAGTYTMTFKAVKGTTYSAQAYSVTVTIGSSTATYTGTVRALIGPCSCPASWQSIETLEKGFVSADEVETGMHVRGPDGQSWKLVYNANTVQDEIWRVFVGDEAVDVNEGHSVMMADGTWRSVRDLVAGDRIKGNDGRDVTVKGVMHMGRGNYRSLQVEGFGYQLGHTVGHNVLT